MVATNTVKKRKIIIGGKEYQMPQKITTLAYMRYIKLRDEIMETEKQQRLYNYNQFVEMMDVIASTWPESWQEILVRLVQ